jgi:predicted RNase H-like HicB family nuclease
MRKSSFTVILEREGDLFVALCPELDVSSQGSTEEEATANLWGAVELFLECADPSEIEARQHSVDREPASWEEAVRDGLIQPAESTTGVPPRIPSIPFDDLMRDLKRDREDR